MSKIILGIHGLGNKPKEELLKKWWQTAIDEGLNNIGKNNIDYNFELIYWADILNDKPLDENETDKDSKYYLREKYYPGRKDFVPHKVELKSFVDQFLYTQFDKIFSDEDFTKNHEVIVEFIVKRYFREIGIYYSQEEDLKDYRKIIMYRILETLKKYEKDEILLIAHSMGSIIIYDTLTLLAPHFKIDKFITIGSPLGLPIIINKIKADTKTDMKPRTPQRVMEWINMADKEDKIAIKSNLSEYYAPNSSGVSPTNIFITNNYEVNNLRNPHKSYGYLRAQQFSEILYGFSTEKEKGWIGKNVDFILQKILQFKNKLGTSLGKHG